MSNYRDLPFLLSGVQVVGKERVEGVRVGGRRKQHRSNLFQSNRGGEGERKREESGEGESERVKGRRLQNENHIKSCTALQKIGRAHV